MTENAEIWQIAIVLCEVKTITDDELIRNFKAAIVDIYVNFSA